MTDQEKAKAAVEYMESEAYQFDGNPIIKTMFYEWIELLRPIAAGTHVIVPIEPNEVVIDAMREARRNCSTSRISGQSIEASYRTEMIVEFSMYAAMIAAAKENE